MRDTPLRVSRICSAVLCFFEYMGEAKGAGMVFDVHAMLFLYIFDEERVHVSQNF